MTAPRHVRLALLAAFALASTTRATIFTRVLSGPVVNDGSESTGGSWEDYDGDGDPDLYVACGNLTPQNDRLYRNDLGLFFALIPGPVASDAAPSVGGTWGDLDGDGDPDLFVSNRQGVNELLYRNDGADIFVSLTSAAPVVVGGNTNSTSWVDLDRDGALDLYVINFNERKRQWRNDGAGNFTEILVGDHVTGATTSISGVWSDFDRDGDQDCYVANGGGVNNDLFRNDGATFVNVSASANLQHGGQSIGESWGDWDNDGWPDLFVANAVAQSDFLYRNLGDGTFARILSGPVVSDAASTVGSAFGDMDDDGDPDLFVGVDGANNRLYRNDGAEFVQITSGAIVNAAVRRSASPGPIGTRTATSTRSPRIAWVRTTSSTRTTAARITGSRSGSSARCRTARRSGPGSKRSRRSAAGRAAIARARSQSGYNSASDPRVCFGLGDATTVDSLKVAWPSGLAETIRNVAADQVLTLVEGATLTAAPVIAAATPGALRIEPNPARQLARVRWTLPGGDVPVVRVLDLRGRVIRTLAPDGAGSAATWNGRDDSGRVVAAGTYFVVVRRGEAACAVASRGCAGRAPSQRRSR
jgi:hypothetical protein